MSVAIIGVGSNLGSREASIRGAAVLLDSREKLAVTAISSIYETAPMGPPQPDYLNAALRVETTLAPTALLRVLLLTERRMGRDRARAGRWGPRSLDLDLLWDERGEVDEPDLKLPHPRLLERPFALAPLLEVAPELQPAFSTTLNRLGGPPPVGQGVGADPVEVVALSSLASESFARPWATVHRTIPPSRRAWAETLADLAERGFRVRCANISHYSKSQWKGHFHGANRGALP